MEPSRQKTRFSIASIVIAVIVISVSLFLCVAGFIGYTLFSTREHGELLALNSIQADQASAALAPALWNFDETQIEQTVESFMKDRRVFEISVMDTDSARVVLAMTRDSKWTPVLTEKHANAAGFLSQKRDIHYREKFVGTVMIVVTPAFLEKDLKGIRWTMLFIIIVVAFLLTLVLYLLLWRIVLKPLKRLNRYAHAIRLETGETSDSLTVPFFGELETLRDSIAAMIAQLRSRNAELREQAISLAESEAKYHTLFDAANDAILLLEKDRFVECNDRTLVMFGVSRDQIVGQTPDRFSPEKQPDGESSRDKVLEKVSLALEGKPQSFEWLHRRDDGTAFDAEVSLTRMQYLGKVQLLAIVRDITERRRAEEDLREKESRLRAIFESSRDAIGVAKNGMHIYANPAYLELFGFSNNDQILGTSVINSITPSHREQMIQRVQRRSAGEAVERFYESRGLKTDGTEFDAEFSLSTYVLHGEIYSVASIRDITDRKRFENALRESEQRYRDLFEGVPICLYRTMSGKILEHNRACTEMLGYADRAEFAGLNADVLWMDPQERRLIQSSLESSDTYDIEVRMKKRNGEIIWVQNQGRVVRDSEGKMLYWDGSLTDITGRKRVREALRDSEEKFSKLFRSSPDAVLLTELKTGKIIEVNTAFEMFSGFSRDELIGHPVLDLNMYSPEGRQKFVSMLKEQGRIHDVEFDLKNKTGKELVVLASAEIIEINGEIHSITILQDITERKKTEASLRATHEQLKASDQQLRAANLQLMASLDELKESEDRFRQMADNIEEIFFLYQKEGNKLLYMSPAITRLFGVPLETIETDPQIIDRAVHPDDVARVKFTEYETFYSTPLNEEFRVVAPNGSVHWVRLRSFLIRDEQGNVVRVAGLATDITVYKNAQEETLRQQQQLIQADKMASLGVMVSGIAHEINNPNNFITMSMPLLRQAWESILPAVEQYRKQGGSLKIGSMDYAEFMKNFDQLMNGVTEGSQRIKRIVADLKDYARIDTMDMNRVFDLNEVTGSAVNLMNSMIRTRTKAFSLTLYNDRLPVKGNVQRLEQVIVNLIHNACDALTSPDQSISVITELRGDSRVALVIADRGCGIVREDLPRITDPFFTTKREKGGTGLGLSISAGIVKDHGGELQFQSEPGKGTVVTLLLPAGEK